jgi:hypothetical protein
MINSMITPYQRARARHRRGQEDNERRVRSGPLHGKDLPYLFPEIIKQIWDQVEQTAREAARSGRLKLYKFFNYKFLVVDFWHDLYVKSEALYTQQFTWWRARGGLPPLRGMDWKLAMQRKLVQGYGFGSVA